MNHLRLLRNALDVGDISDLVSVESCGAISLFVGTTRDSFEGKQVLSLEYEAYEPMALKQLELICIGLRRQWPDIVNIAIFHRLGLVGIGEVSTVIAISSPHRETSLSAVAVAIDDLKKHVPIWKKEVYKDGATWKENKECQWLKNVQSNFFDVGCSDKTSLCNEKMGHVEDSQSVPSQLVQISASEEEIGKRIRRFIEKKRNEIDLCNIMDFTDVTQQKTEDSSHQSNLTQEKENVSMTCARVNSFVVKQELSNCRLKVRRVENNIGPQTRPNYLNTLDKLMVPVKVKCVEPRLIAPKMDNNQKRYSTIVGRLDNVEKYLNIPQIQINNIYKRIKVIEDRLLYLESVSPEYVHFLREKPEERNSECAFESFNYNKPSGLLVHERKLYSVSEIDAIIHRFEQGNLDQNSNMAYQLYEQ